MTSDCSVQLRWYGPTTYLLVFLTNLSLTVISGQQIFGLILSSLSNRWLGVVLDRKSSQDYPVNTGVPQGSILGSILFLLYIINNLPDDVICNIAISADDTTVYFKYYQASDPL